MRQTPEKSRPANAGPIRCYNEGRRLDSVFGSANVPGAFPTHRSGWSVRAQVPRYRADRIRVSAHYHGPRFLAALTRLRIAGAEKGKGHEGKRYR